MYRYTTITLSLALAACVPDSGDEGLLIVKNVAPADGCTIDPATNELGISHGELSSVFPTQYSFIAQIKSRITALEGQEDQRTVFATGANVDLSFPDTTFFTKDELANLQTTGVTKFRALFAAAITPNGGLTDAQFEVTTRPLYDAIYAKAPSAAVPFGEPRFALEVVATIKVTGTLNGDEVTSQPFVFPIRIANDNLLTVVGTCPVPTADFQFGNACDRPQDGPIPCCTQANGDLICPPTVE